MSHDRALSHLGAVLGIGGLGLQVGMGFLHPSATPPNDSAGAFAEYAHSGSWTMVHIGQFVGTLLIALALVAFARSLARQRGIAGAFAVLGGVGAILVAAVFAVQMAVDGVALKATIDAWVNATDPTAKEVAFQVAEGVRSIEKGLSGFFHLVNGVTLLTLGLSVATGRVYPRWLGWAGAASGVGFVIGGILTAHTGFSPIAGTVLLGPLALLVVFLVGLSITMWRRGAEKVSRPPDHAV
jgi:hypothetical protein